MKKSILIFTILFSIQSQYCKGQIILFGIDITKYKPSERVSQKYNCTPNPYFIFAEWRYDQTILFEFYTAKNRTPQMKNPEKYTKELYTLLSKTLGQPFKILENASDSSSLSENFIVWRFKYQNIYYKIALHVDLSNRGHSLFVTYRDNYNSIVDELKSAQFVFTGYWSEDELFKIPEYSPPKKINKKIN